MTFRKAFNAVTILIVVLIGVYLVGPRPEFDEVEIVEGSALMDLVNQRGHAVPTAAAFAKTVAAREERLVASGLLRPEAVARVQLADSTQTVDSTTGRTPVAMVYLHGFSASPLEGTPTANELARRYGANLYFPRLSDHGHRGDTSMRGSSPDRWIREAEAALSAAEEFLGDSVILVGTSTGATLALDLAARFPERVKALVLYSPNIRLTNALAGMVNGPWGYRLLSMLEGGETHTITGLPEECDYIWTIDYHIDGIIALQELVETTMTPATFAQVTVPTMAAYYYRDEEHQDEVVSTAAIRNMMAQLGTPEAQKREHPLAEVSGHVITTDCRTTGLDKVRAVSQSFLEEVVGLTPNPAAGAAVR